MIRAAICMLALAGMAASGAASIAAEGPNTPAKLKVFVSIAPQAYFVERVGGQWVDVNVLVGPGQSYHVFNATPRQMAALGDARLYFKLGLQFEETLLSKIAASNPNLTIVDTARNVPLREMEDGEVPLHDAEHAHQREEHTHTVGGKDPHIWLSPKLVKIQAASICDALRQADPKHTSDFENNLARFCSDLDALDAKLRETLAPFQGRAIFVFHPSYGYFAADYGLKQVAVEVEGKDPGARQLAEMIDLAKAAAAKVIFVQPQYAKKSAQAIAEAIGGEVVELDPLSRDYLKNMEDMAETIRAALARTAAPQNGKQP